MAEEENIPPAFIFKDKYLKKLSNVKSHDDQAKKKIMTILGDTKLTERFINIFFIVMFWIIYFLAAFVTSFLLSLFFSKKNLQDFSF